MARILVVDDVQDTCQMVAEMLQGQHEVLYTDDPSLALEIIRSQVVDLLLTDVYMPRMDGISLADAARQARPGMRIVLMSAYIEPATNREGRRVNEYADLVLCKPFRVSTLRGAIQALIPDPALALAPAGTRGEGPGTA